MKPLSDITVVVAEDERPVRMLLRVVLEAAGARVIEAEHGGVALRLLELHPHAEVLCTDINMPHVDGVALAAEARSLRPDLTIVACSAMDVEQSFPQLAGRIDAVVQKPFVPSELVRAIERAMGARPAARAGSVRASA